MSSEYRGATCSSGRFLLFAFFLFVFLEVMMDDIDTGLLATDRGLAVAHRIAAVLRPTSAGTVDGGCFGLGSLLFFVPERFTSIASVRPDDSAGGGGGGG